MIGGGNGAFIGTVNRIGFYTAGLISDAYNTNGLHD